MAMPRHFVTYARAAVVLIFCAAPCAFTLSPEEVAALNKNHVVILSGTRADTGARTQSSGCLVSSMGHVLTTSHQIDGVAKFEARTAGGETLSLTVVENDPEHELALLAAVPAPNECATLGDSASLRQGSPLVAIATPLDLDFSLVRGVVSSTSRTYRGYPVLQVEMNASPGSSGGPVFDESGALVGVVVGKLQDQPWFTVVNPISNATALLSKHGISGTDSAMGVQELSPAPGISPAELAAVNAYNRGVRSANPAEKAAAYREATTLLPGFFEAWFNLGVALDGLSDQENAAAAYEKALSIKNDSLPALRNLGRLWLRMNLPGKAAETLRTAAELSPGTAQSYNDLGEALRRSGKAGESADCFRKAVSLEPGHAAAHYNLGLALSSLGDNAGAAGAFEAYLRLSPDAKDAEEVRKWLERLKAPAATP